jgi:hypothetical protein
VPFEAPTVEELIAAHIPHAVDAAQPRAPGNHPAHQRRAVAGRWPRIRRERFQTYDEFIMALTAARSQVLVARFRPGTNPTPSAGGRMLKWLGR